MAAVMVAAAMTRLNRATDSLPPMALQLLMDRVAAMGHSSQPMDRVSKSS